jgi:CRP-like cAMP-binding protein
MLEQLLAGVPPEAARLVADRAHRRHFRRHQIVFVQGQEADGCHVVTMGTLAVRVAGPRGNDVTMEVVGPGSVVGELALIPPPAPRSATVLALERAETLAISASDFAELRREHAVVDQVLLVMLANRLRARDSRLTEALYLPAETRVLHRLVDVARHYRRGDQIVVPLSQDDLAGLAGTTRETVNRSLARAAAQGVVELGRERIRVVDEGALRSLIRE